MLKVRAISTLSLAPLIDQHGGNGTIISWLDALTRDCPRKRAASVSDQCHARAPICRRWFEMRRKN